MKIIDPDETKIVIKEDLLEFFSIPGFLNLARVEQFNPKTQNTKNEEQNKFSSGYQSFWTRKEFQLSEEDDEEQLFKQGSDAGSEQVG